ncbi:MAG: fibronectin type III domain-containing protein [Acidimicrobiales bacterium]
MTGLISIQSGTARALTSSDIGSLAATLQDPGALSNAGFGWAIAISGSTAIVGTGLNCCNSQAEAAYVNINSGGSWPATPTVTLLDPGANTSDQFGYSVAISGSTAVVGAPGANKTYIYDEGASGWPAEPTAVLVDPGGTTGDLFGESVSVSASTIVVGAEHGNSNAGIAYVYTKGSSGWSASPTQTLKDPGTSAGDEFGATVTIQGQTIVVAGGYAASEGATYIFTMGPSGWPQTPNVTLPDPGATSGDRFGYGLALSGNTLAVSAPGTNSLAGAAYLYTEGASGWPTTPTVTFEDPGASAGDRFGNISGIALSGSTLLVGADGANGFAGVVYSYVESGSGWPTSPTGVTDDPASSSDDAFGAAMALSGTTAIIGSYGTDGSQGIAYIFALGNTQTSANLVGNPGFESPIGGTQISGCVNQSVGNWLSDRQYASGIQPDIVSSPVHSGSAAAEVQTTPGDGGAFFVQDFPSFPANTSYVFSAWVYPVTGEQQLEFLIGWDRGCSGSSLGAITVDMSPTGTSFSPGNVTAPALTQGAWHQIQASLDASADTITFTIDGVNEGTSSAGPLPPQADATILFGQGTGGGGSVPDHYYYDDVSLSTVSSGVPLAPQSVQLAGGNRSVTVTWAPPQPNGVAIDHYNILTINSDGTTGTVAKTISASSLQTVVSGLNLCEYYRFGVQAVSSDGQVSPIAYPAVPAFTSGPPTAPPKTVVIVVSGVNSSIGSGTYDPIGRGLTYCSSTDGVNEVFFGPRPILDLIDGWKESSTFGAGNRMTDTLASTGAVIFPFSYTKATLVGTPGNPTFRFTGYSSSDVGNTSPEGAAGTLNAEITSIHNLWRSAHIFVVGHSNGGLVAELWWIKFGSRNASGVVHVFALDSPLNGVGASIACCGVGKTLADFYATLWAHQDTLDPEYVALAQRSPLFTAIWTRGDPLYDFADYPASTGVNNIGIVSQAYWTEPSCVNSGYDLSSPACTVIGPSLMDPCGPLNDGVAPFFGFFPSNISLHGVVKNCPGVIDDVMSVVTPP